MTRSTPTQDEGSAMGALFVVLKVMLGYTAAMFLISLLTGRPFAVDLSSPILPVLGAGAVRQYLEAHKGESWIGFGSAPAPVARPVAIKPRVASIPRTLPRQPRSDAARRVVAARRPVAV